MPPKTKITKDRILDAAFEIVRQDGLDALTARRIAEHLKCSTQPIYSVFHNMEALQEDVYKMAIRYTLDTLRRYKRERNISLADGFLHFASEERQLFRTVYLSGRKRYNLTYDRDELREENYAAFLELGGIYDRIPDGRLERIFQMMSFFLIGIGTLINTNSIDVNLEQASQMTSEMLEALLLQESTRHRDE